MDVFHISCLIFILFLTSLTHGQKNDTAGYKTNEKYEDLFMSFKLPTELTDSLNDDNVFEEIKELQPNIVYYIHIEQLPTWTHFIVFQAHAYLHNVTLGYTIDNVPGKHVSGQNIGLVQNATSKGTAEFFLQNDNPFNVTTLLAIVAYNKSAPIPGGCNMEFEVETAPWLRVNITGPTVIVSSQPAKPPHVSGLGDICDMFALHYQAYHLYLPEKDFLVDTYFSYIRSMMTVSRIQNNARKVKESIMGKMQHMYSAYHGTGTVYAVIVTDTAQYAAYVPALTYSCSPLHYTDTCQVLTSMFSRCLCALVLFLGLFVCFYGHSFFQTELFLFTTLMGSIFFYVVVVPLNLSDSSNVMLATLGGVTIGNFWLVLWWVLGSPMLSIVMATLSLSFLITSALFYSVLADIPWTTNNINYWGYFMCCMLTIALSIGPQTTRVNILACSVVGAYAAVVPVDHYVGANLKYVFINIMRRATVPNFNQAVIDPPFQTKDAVLTTLWLTLALAGYILQSQRFGDGPVFPRSDRPHIWGLTPSPSSGNVRDEERPLLYGSTTPLSDNVFS